MRRGENANLEYMSASDSLPVGLLENRVTAVVEQADKWNPPASMTARREVVELEVTNDIADAILSGIDERDLLTMSLDALHEILGEKLDLAGLKPSQAVRAKKGLQQHKLGAVDRVQRLLGAAMSAKNRTKQTSTSEHIEMTAEEIQERYGKQTWQKLVEMARDKVEADAGS